MTGAVIAYAKPSERCTDRLGSGAYVHIGTNKTYTGGDPPIETEAEKWRGFVGATAAVWTETQAFGPTGANNTYTPSPGYLTEAGLIVTPRISCYSRDSVNNIFHVYLGFDIYGVMKTNYTSESGSVEFWLSAVSGSSSGCDLMMYTNSSKNGYNAGKTTFSGLTVVSVVKTIAGTVLFLAPFILPETSPIICILQPIGGVMLISDWVLLLPSEVIGYSGVDDYSQDVCFLCNPRKFKTTSGGFNYYEFESTFSIELRVPISWQQWTVVPLNWAINFEDNAQNVAVVASGGISVALFNTYPHITKNFVSTVFFEDFEDDMSGWSVGDSNSLDGYDYWGISDGEGHYGNMLYCAEVGTHSRRGEQPNTDLNDGYGYYDTNMEAYLTRSFDLRPFKNAWLRYDLSYQMLLDKNLTVEYYNGTWHTPKTYTGGGSDSPEIPIPTSTREIRFIFSSDNEFDPFYDGFGAYLDNIEIRAELSNDSGSMADAGDGFGSATQISISDSYNNYAGYLGSDEDWYQFYISPTQISNHKQICVWLNQPSNSIFNITLYDNNTTIKASPVNSGPALSYVLSSSDQAGWWRIQILPVQGFGQYNFDIQLKQTYQLTVKTMKIEGDAEVINVNIWVDGVRYRSPVHITLTEGTHIVEAEPYFYRRVYWLYMFDHWKDDGSTNNTRIISAEDEMNLTAYYHEFYCPTLFVWNGSEYVYEALLNIHAETDITVQHQIQQTLVLDGIFYKLQLRELDNFTSHIDQVKLYAVDADGEWHTCPLTIAKLNGTYVTLRLLCDDDRRVDLYPSQIIDLKFLPSIPYHETAHFVFEINGYNRKLP